MWITIKQIAIKKITSYRPAGYEWMNGWPTAPDPTHSSFFINGTTQRRCAFSNVWEVPMMNIDLNPWSHSMTKRNLYSPIRSSPYGSCTPQSFTTSSSPTPGCSLTEALSTWSYQCVHLFFSSFLPAFLFGLAKHYLCCYLIINLLKNT